MASVFTIPPQVPFLDALAGELLAWDRERLADTLVLMPSRRACLALRDTFLRLTDGEPLLLPRLTPIGEPDEAELMLDADLELELPPAIAPLRRRLLLTELVLARDAEMKHEQAVRLAGELESFLDELQNEEVDLAALDSLAPAELAEHWQETLVFLQLLRQSWPTILAAEGALDAPVRRRRLLDALSARWRASPPSYPVIAAGLTGTIPSVARLLAVIARLPQGSVVLPGLDQTLDERAWRVLGPSHPQHGLQRLLDRIEVERAAVQPWPAVPPLTVRPARTAMWREVLRPAETTEVWRREISLPPAAFTGLELCEAPDLAAEAVHLALRLRHALETPERRAVLVTPNRYLGRRVAAELQRWGIRVDDSAGVPLDQSPPGSFLLLAAHLLAEDASPATILSALKHPLASGGIGRRDFRRYVRALERGLLRGPRLAGGLAGLVAALKDRDPDDPWPAPVPADELLGWLSRLWDAARPLSALLARGDATMVELLDAHLGFAEHLAADDRGSPAELWAREAGQCAYCFVSDLRLAAEGLGPVPAGAYPALLAVLMGTQSVRPRQPAHPRVAILGQLESRLLQADLVLVGGLCEGVWPRTTLAGPWLNRLMRRHLGLPPVEQEVGIAAHDFMMTASSPEVVLSWARKDERGSPSTLSRWLVRLKAVQEAAGVGSAPTAAEPCWLDWVAAIDDPACRPEPIARPEPRPPLSARPRELWATDVERLMRDPYSVYAKRVLRLEPLEELDADPGLAERGQLIHAALEEFVRTWPDDLPEDPRAALLEIGLRHFAQQAHRPQVWAMWWPRFERIATWFCEQERQRRAELARIAIEIRGACELVGPGGPFRIRARADRVEVRSDGRLAIVDYKTGGLPSARDVRQGLSPQLVIEGLIAADGGFERVPAGEPVLLLFWQLRGGDPAGEERNPIGRGEDLKALIADGRAGLERLIAHFDSPATAYLPVPRPEVAPAFSDYEHLARIGEWWGTEGPA